jgi:aminomethyltransferase
MYSTRRSRIPARDIRSSPFRARAPKDILQKLTPVSPLDQVRYYHFTSFGKVNGVDCLIARTGYTGEDGFEIYFDPEASGKIVERADERRGSLGP